MARWTPAILTALGFVITAAPARAQQTTPYHLHKEATAVLNSTAKKLLLTGPDAAQTALQTANMKNVSGNGTFPIANFETQSLIPGRDGVIPGQSTVSFSFKMKVTALPSNGNVYAYARVRLNTSAGQELCHAQDTTALGTTLDWHNFSCTTNSSPVSMTASDRFFLEVDVVTTGIMGNHNLFGELDVEIGGAGSTGLDSIVTIPNPAPNITSLSLTSGYVTQAVTINGSAFGSTQGSSTVTFNGTTTSITSWSDTSIGTTVPAGATTGPVVVTVNSTPSNGVTFTVIPHINSVTPSAAAVGQSVTISGTSFGASQGSSTISFNGTTATSPTWSDTSIGVAVPAGATTGPVVVTVGGNPSNGVTFTVVTTGTLTGTITRATGGSALSGATIQAVLVGVIKGTATSAANGTYTISNLDAGTYDVRVSATGFSSEVRGGTTISANATTTVNVAMSAPGTVAGKVTQADGTTPIAGAAVAVYSGPFQKGAASTNGTGDYTIASLHPGTYTVQAASVGYRTKEQSATVNESATTTVNLSLDAATSGPVLYAYDSLGRLIEVTDASGDSAIYRYDAVGNITAIERPGTNGSSGVTISGFTPASGPVGAIVTIFGTGFTASSGQTCVTFNGTTATVTSATATQIVSAVPAGATSGVVAIAPPCGSASSAPVTFTVTTAAATPTITGFTPTLVVAGNTITVNGTNFDTTPANDRLTVNVMDAQVTTASAAALQATVPSTTTGRVSIATPGGTATSTDYLWVAPSPQYAVADVDSTDVLTFGTAATISVPGDKIALRAFEGTHGHRASVVLTNNGSTFGTMALYTVYGNSGTAGFSVSGGFMEPSDLTATGTYSLVLDPGSTSAVSVTVTVYDVPADFSAPIVADDPDGVAVSIGQYEPGRNARLTFAGTAGNRMSVSTSADTTIPSSTISILNPDGSPLGSVGATAGSIRFLEPLTLPSTGTYSVLIDPSLANTGNATVNLYTVPADTTGTVTINGSPVPVPLTGPGQNGTLTFTGSASQQVTVRVTGNMMHTGITPGVVNVRLLKSSDGSTLAQAGSSAENFNLATTTLPSTPPTDTYTVSVDPTLINTGSLNISVTSP